MNARNEATQQPKTHALGRVGTQRCATPGISDGGGQDCMAIRNTESPRQATTKEDKQTHICSAAAVGSAAALVTTLQQLHDAGLAPCKQWP